MRGHRLYPPDSDASSADMLVSQRTSWPNGFIIFGFVITVMCPDSRVSLKAFHLLCSAAILVLQLTLSVCVCSCTGYQYTYSTSKVRIFLGSDDILAGPRNFKGLFWGENWV